MSHGPQPSLPDRLIEDPGLRILEISVMGWRHLAVGRAAEEGF